MLVNPSAVFALTVSPAKIEVIGDPGTTVYTEIELYNEQTDSKTFFSSFENFEPAGDSGTPYFVGAKDGLATWMRAADSVILAPAQRQKIPVSITIPDQADPGGYFAAVFFGNSPPQQTGVGGEVSVGGKVGVLVLLRVAGDVEESAGVLDFQTLERKRFINRLPVTFTYRVNNAGGDRIVPLGDLEIKNTFRLKTTKFSANKNEGSVLPGSIRKFEAIWQGEDEGESAGFFGTARSQWKNFHLGWYTAKLSLVWGSTNESMQSSFHFFVFPWQLLVIIFVILLVVFYFGRMGIKKYNKWIIAQATKAQRKK